MLKKILISITILLLLITILFLIFIIPWEVKSIPNKKESDTRIVTYNIKYAEEYLDNWEIRKETIIEQLESYHADIICLQEANYQWMNNIDGLPSILNDYNYFGVGREDGKEEGEYTPIFYLKDKYTLVDNSTMWLSETPEEVSIGWDASTYRIVTIARLENNATKEIITVYNTHLDHIGEVAKEKSIELILKIVSEETTPYIITGDLNITSFSNNYKEITKSLEDTYKIAKDTMKYGTINYNINSNLFHFIRIDYIFTSRDDFTINSYRVDPTIKVDNQPVSDHFPVIVDFDLK